MYKKVCENMLSNLNHKVKGDKKLVIESELGLKFLSLKDNKDGSVQRLTLGVSDYKNMEEVLRAIMRVVYDDIFKS